jgi:hypothetical protein
MIDLTFHVCICILYIHVSMFVLCCQPYTIQIQIQIFLFPIKEPFRAEQLTKNLIQWLWIDYIDSKMTTFYETNKSKFNHTIDIVIVAFECMLYNKHSVPSVVK